MSALFAAVLLLVLASPCLAQHEGDLSIFATASGGGQLAVAGDTTTPIVLQPSFCAAGTCLYANTEPGFVTPTSPAGGLFPVSSGSTIRLEIVSLGAGAAIKVGAAVLDAPGESASLGTAPSVHVHPSWQLTLPANAQQQRTVSFRLTAAGSPHATSATVSLTLSTFEEVTTTTSTTTTSTTESTTTTTMAPVCGDGFVSEVEDCDNGELDPVKGEACLADCTWGGCGDPDHSGSVTAADALFTLRAAVGATACDACLCDVQTSSTPVTAGDALVILKKAVGQEVKMNCPGCG